MANLGNISTTMKNGIRLQTADPLISTWPDVGLVAIATPLAGGLDITGIAVWPDVSTAQPKVIPSTGVSGIPAFINFN